MESLKVGIIGAGWMGHVHARAYQRLTHHYPDLAVRPRAGGGGRRRARAGRGDARRALRLRRAYADWRELLADPDGARGQRDRTELPAPRDRRRACAAGRQAPLDREAGRADRRRRPGGRRRGGTPAGVAGLRSASTTATHRPSSPRPRI